MSGVSASELLDVWSVDPTASAGPVGPVYEEMRRIARRELRQLRPGDTLGTTALVHEAYLRLVAGPDGFADERHFLATAALAMRQVLIDECRRRGAFKRGAAAERVGLEIAEEEASLAAADNRAVDVLALEEALRGLASLDVRLAKLVVLRFYGGLSLEEAARCLEVSGRTAKRDWQKARLFLWKALASFGAPG